MTNGALMRHSSRSGSVLPPDGAPGQSSAHALATVRGRQGSRGTSGADASSSNGGGPEARPT
eukprot:8829515-Alexandrium_andersonii.AAC.1